MLIDRILFPIRTLGPGERLVIWTLGCSKHCPHCANPELWPFDPGRDMDVDALADAIRRAVRGRTVDGITVTGGDPLEQSGPLLALLERLRPVSGDVIVYTGYTYEQLQRLLSPAEMARLRRLVTVLIDGPYVHARNDNACPLRGSTNQRLLFFDESARARYQAYLRGGRQIQNVFYGDKMISVGIHNRGC